MLFNIWEKTAVVHISSVVRKHKGRQMSEEGRSFRHDISMTGYEKTPIRHGSYKDPITISLCPPNPGRKVQNSRQVWASCERDWGGGGQGTKYSYLPFSFDCALSIFRPFLDHGLKTLKELPLLSVCLWTSYTSQEPHFSKVWFLGLHVYQESFFRFSKFWFLTFLVPLFLVFWCFFE